MSITRPVAALLAAAFFATLAQPVSAFDTAARTALVIDMQTGAELLSKDADLPYPPASMSKLMTLNMVFEALQSGRLSLDDTFRVSIKAWKMEGSSMFLKEGERVRVADLLRGVIVQSGNDACVVIAENLAGSEEAFAQAMTTRAHELGMTNTSLTNSTGWPHPGHKMSVRDLVTIASRIITEFPEFYPYFAETEFTWAGITQKNRNPLLALDIDADGLKTGHTQEAGYGLVGSAKRGDRRIVFAITGLESAPARSVESERILEWAFRHFENLERYKAGDRIGEAEVWIGERGTVGLTTEEDVMVTVPFGAADNVTAQIRYRGPVEAPIAKGDRIADLVLNIPDMPPIVRPLIAAEDVERGGYLTRLGAAAKILIAKAFGDGFPGAGLLGGEPSEGDAPVVE
jgi:D-alanyl-D-alanine carboxypeptidase (penicillin-binding protein 5/6)